MSRDFDAADECRERLKKELGVLVNDGSKTWCPPYLTLTPPYTPTLTPTPRRGPRCQASRDDFCFIFVCLFLMTMLSIDDYC